MNLLTRSASSSALVAFVAPFGPDRVNNDLGDTEGGFTMPKGVYPRTPVDERFWDKVALGPVPAHRPDLGECWLWTASHDPDGYGAFAVEHRQKINAHIFLVGGAPRGLTWDHLCRVRRCVRPDHLELVTGRENTLRGEGPSALNARKTVCPRGHLYDEANTYRHGRKRHCRQCMTSRRRRYDE